MVLEHWSIASKERNVKHKTCKIYMIIFSDTSLKQNDDKSRHMSIACSTISTHLTYSAFKKYHIQCTSNCIMQYNNVIHNFKLLQNFKATNFSTVTSITFPLEIPSKQKPTEEIICNQMGNYEQHIHHHNFWNEICLNRLN